MPGIGPLIATAIEALAPTLETFRSGRDFASCVGLTPVQRSIGGKERLGRTSRTGERTLRRLLIIAASAVVRWARRKGVPADSWLGRMLARKPLMLVIVAVASQERAYCMGPYHDGWDLLSSGRHRVSRADARLSEGEGQVWRNASKAGFGEPGSWAVLRARCSDVVLTLALPNGLAAYDPPHQRPDTGQHPITRSARHEMLLGSEPN